MAGSITYEFEPYNLDGTLYGYVGREEMADLAASKLGGTSVEVLNSQGDVLGNGLTTPAQVGYDTASVTFALEVPEATLYTVAVAGVPGPTFTFEELEANNFSVVLQQTISADESLNLVCPTEIEDWRRRHGDVGCPWLWGE